MRTLATAAALVLLAFAAGAVATNMFLTTVYTAFTTPCEQEDSNNCYWDASDRGNRTGTSFVTISGTTYLIVR